MLPNATEARTRGPEGRKPTPESVTKTHDFFSNQSPVTLEKKPQTLKFFFLGGSGEDYYVAWLGTAVLIVVFCEDKLCIETGKSPLAAKGIRNKFPKMYNFL